MSDNPYLDQYTGRVMRSRADKGLEPECVELVTIRAVSHQHAEGIMKDAVSLGTNEFTEVRRHRHPRLVSSPGDRKREHERAVRMQRKQSTRNKGNK